MESLLLSSGFPGDSPGNNSLLFGNLQRGFYGMVPADEFINGVDLANKLGIEAGIAFNTDINWMKFSSDGKTLFIPQKPIRHTLSWIHVYNAGCVYGTGDYGRLYPYQRVLQDKKIVIKGHLFKVRLMTGAATDPAGPEPGGEWNKFIYPLYDGEWLTMNPVTDFGADRASNANGTATFCIESQGVGGNDISKKYIIRRGFNTIREYFASSMDSGNYNFGWRPVLELV